jgi:hypothetical protein
MRHPAKRIFLKLDFAETLRATGLRAEDFSLKLALPSARAA